MSDDLKKYLDLVFGGLEGYVYCPVKRPDSWDTKFFEYPSQRQALEDWINTSNQDHGAHVYISPAIYSEPRATKSCVREVGVTWVEFDGTETFDRKDLPIPSAIVQTSTSTHYHCYWKVDPSAPEVIEDVNRRITYYLGADTSGWDVTQLLRPPSTVNRKHDLPVLLAHFEATKHELPAFDPAPNVEARTLEVFEPEVLLDGKMVIREKDLPESLVRLIKLEEPPVGARSSFLVKLAYELAEEGLNELEIVSLLYFTDKRVGKFEGRTDQLLRLSQIAELALHKVSVQDAIIVYSYEDVLNKSQDLQWILHPWIHTRSLSIISSAPNVGKTQICLQLLSCLDLGIPFLGKSDTTSNKHSSLFISLEMDFSGLKYILNSQKKNLKQLPSQLNFIDESRTLTQLENLVDEYKCTIIVVDSFTELLDETEGDNETTRARTVLKWTRKIRRRYNCAIVLIHHNRKATEGNKKPKGLADLAGTFQLGKDSDTVLQLYEDGKGIEVSSVKCRYGPKESFYVKRNENLWFELLDETTRQDQRTQGTDGESQSESKVQSSSPPKLSLVKSDASDRSESVQSNSPGTVNLKFTGD